MQTLAEKFQILTDAAKAGEDVEQLYEDWKQVEPRLAAFHLDLDLRRIDPYREFKEAHAAGKTIQLNSSSNSNEWYDYSF